MTLMLIWKLIMVDHDHHHVVHVDVNHDDDVDNVKQKRL
jgi:hypothetical protein